MEGAQGPGSVHSLSYQKEKTNGSKKDLINTFL